RELHLARGARERMEVEHLVRTLAVARLEPREETLAALEHLELHARVARLPGVLHLGAQAIGELGRDRALEHDVAPRDPVAEERRVTRVEHAERFLARDARFRVG